MSTRLPQILMAAAALVIVIAVAAGAWYFLVRNDSSANATVRGVAFGTDVTADGQLINPRNFFSPTSKEIRASVALENVKAGSKISGKWYQLNTRDAGSTGQLINSADITVKSEDIQSGKLFGASFSLTSQSGIPEDSWLLRVYEDGHLIKTAGFIVTRAVTTTAAPPAASPAPVPTPASYTVVAGDTLQTIAARFKPANEPIDGYVTRLATLNQLTPTSAVAAGRVLRIPGALP